MTTHVGSTEAAHMLGVSKPTLYAYVSRGMLTRLTAVDGRTSLYDRDEIARLAARSRRRDPSEPPTIDVRIASAITELHDEGVRYRGLDTATLAREHTFEQVAELLWTGTSTGEVRRFAPAAADLDRCRATSCQLVGHSLLRLAAAATALEDDGCASTAPDAARRLIAVAPSLFGGPRRGSVAERLARAWARRGVDVDALAGVIDRAMVLLADHELAISTLAVRVACSGRASPLDAFAAGLHVLRGALHGSASASVVDLLDLAARDGGAAAVTSTLAGSRRLPGFGHSIYRSRDPRFAPLIEVVRTLPGARSVDVVDDVLLEAGSRIERVPNVDFALGSLAFVAGLPRDVPIFAIARLAGWAAHYDEELTERPLRFRGLASARER